MSVEMIDGGAIQSLPDGNVIKYRKSGSGIFYHDETSTDVIGFLDLAHHYHLRLTIHYGCTKTGKAWGDSSSGYIGHSTGMIKIPLLVHNSRSSGGCALLYNCIVKIESSRGKRVLWQHPTYHAE